MWTAIYFEDAVRVEVFERLGMVHTCCKVTTQAVEELQLKTPDTLQLEAWGASDEERHQVRSEDAELNEQLELILQAYIKYASQHGPPSEDMLQGWWRILDEILPEAPDDEDVEDSDEEEKGLDVCDERDARQREALARMGYGDLEFVEVIRRHFREYLDDEDWMPLGGE